MKLQDPRLEALLEAYRDDRRPGAVMREELWERLVEHQRPRRAWVRVAVATAVAVAALVLLWLASRGVPGELARARGSGSGEQAPFGHQPAPPHGTASAAGGRAAVAGEPAPAERRVEPSPTVASTGTAASEASMERTERAPASGSRTTPSSAPTSAAPRIEPEPTLPIDDLALIEAAETALRSGTPARALELLRRHEERFPSAPTAEERQALRVLALCAAGREVEGRGARWAFLREHPRSAYRERIEKACPAA